MPVEPVLPVEVRSQESGDRRQETGDRSKRELVELLSNFLINDLINYCGSGFLAAM